MSFLSGSSQNQPLPDQRPLSLDPVRLNTDEAARPVPVLLGRNEIALTFITDHFDAALVDHTVDGGKKGDQTAGQDVFFSFAGLLCHGPVDRIRKITFDNDEVWPLDGSVLERTDTADRVIRYTVTNGGTGYTEGTVDVAIAPPIGGGTTATARAVIKDGVIVAIVPILMGSGYTIGADDPVAVTITDSGTGEDATANATLGAAPYAEISIEGQGDYRIYWGTEDQEIDPALLRLSADSEWNTAGIAAGNASSEHGAYLGQCYMVAIRHFVGYNRGNLQNIKVELERFPGATVLAGALDDIAGDCNPATAILDGWTNKRYGLGLDLTDTDETGFGMVNDICSGEGIGINPLLTRQSTFQDYLLRCLETVDGYYTTLASGLFTIGLIRAEGCTLVDEELVPPTLPHFDEESLIEEPKLDIEGWEETRNMIYVKFRNRENRYADDSVSDPELANFQITGEVSPITFDRPMITRPATAEIIARNIGKVLSRPGTKGSIRVRKSKLQGLLVGGAFRLHWAHWNLCNLRCRAHTITIPDPYKPEVEIEFEADRAQIVEVSYAPPAYVSPQREVVPPEAITQAMWIELPYIEGKGGQPLMIVLAARPIAAATGFTILDTTNSEDLLQVTSFALYGTLDVALDEDDTTIQFTLDEFSAGSFPSTITATEGAAENWLAFVISPGYGAGDWDHEIISIHTPSALGGNSFSCTAIHERFDSKRFHRDIGAKVFIQRKSVIISQMIAYKFDYAVGATANLKLKTRVGVTTLDAADAGAGLDIEWQGRSQRFWKPRGLRYTTGGDQYWWQDAAITVTRADDIGLAWDPVNRSGAPGMETWPGARTFIWHVEVRKPDGTFVTYKYYAKETAAITLKGSLVDLGGETGFKIRIFARQGLHVENDTAPPVSLFYDEMTFTYD